MKVPNTPMSDDEVRTGQFYQYLRDSHMVRLHDGKIGKEKRLRMAEDLARADIENMLKKSRADKPYGGDSLPSLTGGPFR